MGLLFPWSNEKGPSFTNERVKFASVSDMAEARPVLLEVGLKITDLSFASFPLEAK
jgi:hypothetical protein